MMSKSYNSFGDAFSDIGHQWKLGLTTLIQGYNCGYCGKAYFTRRGVEKCCKELRDAGVEEDPILRLYGVAGADLYNSADHDKNVHVVGYPGQFDGSMMPDMGYPSIHIDGHRK